MKTGRKVREIVRIDEEKCDGCGLCVPQCAEGAIKIIDGKARLAADNLCDGLGACLGHCPQGAITIEKRAAQDFDEAAVHAALAGGHTHAPAKRTAPAHAEPPLPLSTGRDRARGGSPDARPCGCPGSMQRELRPARMPAAHAPHADPESAQDRGASAPAAAPAAGGDRPSQLRGWPVQLMLLPERGSMWEGADVLLSADCVPFAMAGFHEKLLAGKTLAIACPKLDDGDFYVEKLSRIFAGNAVKSVTVARMEVPCCGIDGIVQEALARAKKDLPVKVITLGLRGDILSEE
ncbi:MAG: hypothetical protein A2X36_08115 [Elusimicrobia bacterium GWA2_69_24]|nr:MAG: hypothetical protein A2X36_08115 [Elusimicrobia bacterium GWA2_69_24]